MLRFLSYNIVFQEVSGEVTLAINLSNCPNRCKGCHSPYLQEDKGDTLDESVIAALLAKYGEVITCFCFMGGDNDPATVESLSLYIRETTQNFIKTAW
jgi:anaerobic ribonucleoside-triphosphate reductase activating protein